MDNRNKLAELRARFRLNSLAGFKNIQHADVPDIPKKRTLFPGSKTDYWYEVEFPLLDITACVYELGPKCIFLPHLHFKNSEQIIPISKNCKIEVVTNTYERVIEFPNGVYFAPKEPHAVINLKNEVVIFLVIWSPKMSGWSAQWLKREKTNDK